MLRSRRPCNSRRSLRPGARKLRITAFLLPLLAVSPTLLTAARAQTDGPPLITAPATAQFTLFEPGTIVVTATDPDGDPILSLTASPLPGTSTFTADPLNTSGTFAWTPGFADDGFYTITFTASNALAGSASTSLLVGGFDRPPVVTGPFSVSGVVGQLIQFDVHAQDPDGDAILILTMGGVPPIGPFFLPDPDNRHGVFSWTPTAADVGTWSATFTACNSLCGSLTTLITVSPGGDTPPVVSAPAAVSAHEGEPVQFVVTASAADGGHVALSASPLPPGATFSDHGDNTGTFLWVPGPAQAGSYTVQFTGVDGAGLTGTATTAITVLDSNTAPVAEAGGPYYGVLGVPVVFDGTQSYDPDGDALEYLWDFGDGTTGTGPMPAHVYPACGVYSITLTVRDPGGLSGQDYATVSLCTTCAAYVYLRRPNDLLRLQSGKPTWCALFEPSPGCFPIELLDLRSFRMGWLDNPGAGTIAAIPGKTVVTSDWSGNGAPEVEVCFSKEDLRLLFAALPAGESTVAIEITATGPFGGTARGFGYLRVLKTGQELAASLTPNPLRGGGTGTLAFKVPSSGPVRVRLFDLNGRLVRTLLDESAASAGGRSVAIDGRDGSGRTLPSAVYFYRIEASGRTATGRFLIAR